MSMIELIFGGISALSAVVTAWGAVARRSEALPPPVAKPGREHRRRDWRPSTTQLLVLASAVTGVVGIYLIVNALTDDQEIKEAPLLRAVIPATFSKDCEAEEPPDRALASVTCKPSPRVPIAHYALFNDRDAMNKALSAKVAELGIPPGNCETNGFAVSSYGTEGEGNWGRLLCYVDKDGSHVSWTNEDLRVLASALAPVGADNELYEWWRDEGGPLPTSNLKSFPTGSEESLLEWIPAAYREGCTRSGWGGRTADASVVCTVAGVDALGYASYESVVEMRKAFETRLGRAPEKGEPPCSARTKEGDSSYNSGDSGRAGRLVCYISDDGIGYYEWTYDSAYVSAYAQRDDGDMVRLFGWWRRAETPG
ncbi:MAG TPA: hypothetical protein VFT79_04180 [Solirubrobacterales bacterium]|nr:hypothetical protein [Solirubrobacterales bacterium]